MLYHAESRRLVCLFTLHSIMSFNARQLLQAVDEFVLGLGAKETNLDKRRKIAALVLHEEEWTQVCLFCNLLQVSLLLYSWILMNVDLHW
jgi:hypothetical protein